MGNEGVNDSLLLLHSWMNLRKWHSTAVLKLTHNINSKLIDTSLCPWPSILRISLMFSSQKNLQKLLCPVILHFTIWWSIETKILICTEISKATGWIDKIYTSISISSPLWCLSRFDFTQQKNRWKLGSRLPRPTFSKKVTLLTKVLPLLQSLIIHSASQSIEFTWPSLWLWLFININVVLLLLLLSYPVMSDSLWSHWLQHAKRSCPTLSLGVCTSSFSLHWWCYPGILSSDALFFCPQSFPASGSFPVCWLFTTGSQSIGTLASASVLQWVFRVVFL